MASYIQGYDEERFVNKIDQNFLCQICFNVLKEPVLCPANQHSFCRGCITKHLKNSQTCPTCADELTVETLIEPPRMVKDFLNESKIRCVYINRGCQEVVELQYLDSHEDTCEYAPAVCTNEGCCCVVNKRDLIHHESEVCENRKLKCHSCGEMRKTLADLEEKVERKTTDLDGKLKVINNKVDELKIALVEAFNEMKDVLTEGKKEESKKIVKSKPSGDKESIIVAGGVGTNSVEMFNWRQRAWSPLRSMPKNREGATSFIYNNHMTIAGGTCGWSRVRDTIIMNIDPRPDLSTIWSDCPVRLPHKLSFHNSVLYHDELLVSGGFHGSSDVITAVQLVPPYTVKTLSGMPERRRHGMEIFSDNLLIVGGKTTDRIEDSLDSVVLYDIKKNVLKLLSPLPYEVSEMATVRWRDNIVVIGGVDKHGKPLDTVIIYNVKTGKSHMLPSMRFKRRGCTAVVIENNIVVLGGLGEQVDWKSVEGFNFERYSWEELPAMSKARYLPTAVAV